MFKRFHNQPDASGAPAAGSTPPAGQPSSAPPTPTPPPAPASDEPPAWAKALIAKVDALEGTNKKLEADKGAAEQKTMTVEQQFEAQRAEFAKFQAAASADKIEAAVVKVASGLQFPTPQHADGALALFKAQHRLEVADGKVIATGQSGKPQHLGDAFAAWAKGPSGALFITAAVQPGAGAPPGAVPDAAPKRWSEMTADERTAAKTQGIAGRLTPNGPMLRLKPTSPHVAKMNELSNRLIAKAHGAVNGTGK